MAPPKRKSRDWLEKKRITGPLYTHRQTRKRSNVPRRVQDRQNVPELVYRLLATDKHNQGFNKKGLSKVRDRFYGRMRKYQNRRELSCDTPIPRGSSESVEESEYTESRGTSTENLTEVMDATNTSAVTTSESSSVSNISVEPITLANSIDTTRALLKKMSLVEIINNYIKAGIEEGKRRAKKYIRKALSFGVKSGYLIPTDPRGQVIRVSPTLVDLRRSDVELRKRRRRARRGEEEPPVIDRKDVRGGSSPSRVKSKRPRDTSVGVTVPRKRKKKSRSRSPRMNFNVNQSIPDDSVDQDDHGQVKKRRQRHKKRHDPIKKRESPRSNYKGVGVKKRSAKRGRNVKSKFDEKNNDDAVTIRRSRRNRSDVNSNREGTPESEANHGVMTERRKSTERQEGNSRVNVEESRNDLEKENDEERVEEPGYEIADENAITNEA